jgi:hypothetical protein
VESLLAALDCLSAGQHRLDLRTLVRALTTLGSERGTGASRTGASRTGGGGGGGHPWRGMGAAEAIDLIDAINQPQQVGTTCRRFVHVHRLVDDGRPLTSPT